MVEDNAGLRAYIKKQLVSSHKVIEAGDVEEGIQKALSAIPDLVVNDVMMPRKNGYQLCQTLKTDERTSHIPVILLTAKTASEEKIG